jgi:hypothetical protein
MIGGRGKQTYHPELISRKGEMIAWATALLVVIGWLILYLSGRNVTAAIPFLVVFLVFSGLAISLGNWMDRHTSLVIDEHAIEFRNGLRHIRALWSEIKEVRVTPSQWGKKVQVYGERVYFTFRTLSEVKVQGELKGRFGFARGDEILREIVLRSALVIVERPGEGYTYGVKDEDEH